MAVLRFAPRPVLRSVFSSRIMWSLFNVHPCRSKQEAAAFFIYSCSASCLVPRSRQIQRLLPVAILVSSLTHFVRLRSSRLASRRPSRSHAVSPHRLVLISSRLARLPHACLSAVLFSSSRRSPHALPPLPSSSPHDRMTHDGHEYRLTLPGRTSKERTSRTPIGMIRIARRPHRNASSHIRKKIRRMKRKRDEQARRHGKTERRDGGTAARG